MDNLKRIKDGYIYRDSKSGRFYRVLTNMIKLGKLIYFVEFMDDKSKGEVFGSDMETHK